MRNYFKNGLIAILVVLFALCLVSCGGLAGSDGGDEDSGGSEGDVTFRPRTTSVEYICATSSGDTYTLRIDTSDGFRLTLIYEGNAPDITGQDYFSSVGLKDAEHSLERSGGTGYYEASTRKGAKEAFIRLLLPSTKTWTIYFTSKEDSSRNKSHKISAEYVTKILTWLDEQ